MTHTLEQLNLSSIYLFRGILCKNSSHEKEILNKLFYMLKTNKMWDNRAYITFYMIDQLFNTSFETELNQLSDIMNYSKEDAINLKKFALIIANKLEL